MRWLLAAAICAAVLVSGCGGGDSESASTATGASSAATAPATTQDTAGAPQPSGQSAGGQKRNQSHSQAGGFADGANGSTKQGGSAPHIAAVKVPPISSAPIAGEKAPAPGVKTVKGADDSVQTYGVESTSSARTQATVALAAYLDARRREDWAAACEALARKPTEQMGQLTKSLSQQGKGSGCAAAMAALGEGSPEPAGTTITEVLSLRSGGEIPGDPSYLIFSGPPGQTLYSMPMYLEGGWKVGLAVPAELPL